MNLNALFYNQYEEILQNEYTTKEERVFKILSINSFSRFRKISECGMYKGRPAVCLKGCVQV